MQENDGTLSQKKKKQEHPTKRLATKEMKTESSSLPTKHKDTI